MEACRFRSFGHTGLSQGFLLLGAVLFGVLWTFVAQDFAPQSLVTRSPAHHVLSKPGLGSGSLPKSHHSIMQLGATPFRPTLRSGSATVGPQPWAAASVDSEARRVRTIPKRDMQHVASDASLRQATAAMVVGAGTCAIAAVVGLRQRRRSSGASVPTGSHAAFRAEVQEFASDVPPRMRRSRPALLPATTRARSALCASPPTVDAGAESAELKQQLFAAISAVDAGKSSDVPTTDQILGIVERLEAVCPAPPDLVPTAPERLAGPWLLLWTAQPVRRNDGGGLLSIGGFINPIENQAYSNNPMRGAANPILPADLQENLERMFGLEPGQHVHVDTGLPICIEVGVQSHSGLPDLLKWPATHCRIK